MDLFENSRDFSSEPLAHRMRPRTLEEYVGQDHIVGKGRLLRRSIQADQLSSVIFYGPPGTGKTTLARVIANSTESYFVTLNAVLSGVKDIREAIQKAKDKKDLHDRRTILFVDEVHRWNKAQQDALLPWVENGTFILIGATTENPFFEVNSALVSRSRIFQLTKLNKKDLIKIAALCLKDKERGYGNFKVEFEKGALEHLAEIANGDARSLLNAIELAIETTPKKFPPEKGSKIFIFKETAEESIQKKIILYDKEGDYHFDTISAFIKSLRGSDPDASLFWLAKMIKAGEDPKYMFRRMLISASEDVGMADPNALRVVESAAAAFERIGLPEGRFHLAQAALYLSTAPKSNSALGLFDALSSLEKEQDSEVPSHLKDASRDKKGFGHGEGYLYPHAYKDHWVSQQYLPNNLKGRVYYNPSNEGYEKQIREEVQRKREVQLESLELSESSNEILSFSPPEKIQDEWINRIYSSIGETQKTIKDNLISLLKLQRHELVIDINAGKGIILWDLLRAVPEGGVHALEENKNNYDLINNYRKTLESWNKPEIFNCSFKNYKPEIKFEALTGRNILTREKNKKEALSKIKNFLKDNGRLAIAEIIPFLSTRLSDLNSTSSFDKIKESLKEAENIIFNDTSNPIVNWNENDIKTYVEELHFKNIDLEIKTFNEKRIITEKDIEKWLNSGNSMSYGSILLKNHNEKYLDKIKNILVNSITKKEINWTSKILFLKADI